MKLILDLDEITIKNMQGYTALHGITINELVTKLFIKYVQEPSTIIDDLHDDQDSLNELEDFRNLLVGYLNEMTYDLESLAASSESYETDKDMARVFKVLNRDIIEESFVLTTLFKAYIEGS